jgi:hypothetical protein
MVSKKRYKVFRSSLNKLLLHSVIPFIISLVLINIGRKNAVLSTDIQLKHILLGYLPLCLGILIIFWIVISFSRNSGKEIVITPLTITLKHRGREKIISWDNIMFKPPADNRRRFRKASVSNAKENIVIEEFYFPDFELIMEVIKAARESRQSSIRI